MDLGRYGYRPFGPKKLKGRESNWLKTIYGNSWFAILRVYSVFERWINKTQRPGEIELGE